MTDELKTLAGLPAGGDIFKNLRWIDLIEFAETFGVGVDELEKLDAPQRFKAYAWLVWKASRAQEPFEQFLENPIAADLFQSQA